MYSLLETTQDSPAIKSFPEKCGTSSRMFSWSYEDIVCAVQVQWACVCNDLWGPVITISL